MPAKKKVTVVTSAYNEAECVGELARRLLLVFERHPAYDFEVIVAENGSLDDTFEHLLKIRREDGRFRIVQLSRSFGFQGGLAAALSFADGDAAILMASDLQDPPELISEFLERWEEGYEDVYGVIVNRGGTGPIRRMNSRIFYWVVSKLSEQPMPENARDFRLLDRRVYEHVREMAEPNALVRGLAAWTGFRSVGVEFRQPERFAGESKASTRGVSEAAVRTIFSHSLTPLRVMPVIGVTLFGLSFLALLGLTANTLVEGVPFPGFGTIVALMLMMFGVLFCFLSVLGVYVGLIYEQVRNRPQFVLRQTVGLGERAAPGLEARELT